MAGVWDWDDSVDMAFEVPRTDMREARLAQSDLRLFSHDSCTLRAESFPSHLERARVALARKASSC